METKRLAKLLQGVSFSADLPDEMVRTLATISQTRVFPAGTILFEEGAPNHELYLVWSGRVALDMHIPGHGNVRLLCLGPGDMVAWSAVLEEGEMTASAVATENTEVVALPADKLLAACERDHHLGYEVMRRMARQLARRLLATRLQLLELTAKQSLSQIPCETVRQAP
jgi:CRP/FNR family transcriptional regulator, cyclic AMP receptor protein